MSWHGETNPHFWPRDPPRPPSDQPGPSRPQPGKKIRPRLPPAVEPVPNHPPPLQPSPRAHHPGRKLRPVHVRLPPPVEPVASHPQQPQPNPRADEPAVPPTSQDHWPMHPHEPSQDHWPLEPHQASQDGPTQPRPHPKRQQPPPRRQGPPAEEPDRWRPSKEQNLIYPSPNRTNPCTWFIAVFCVILWVVIILGGILILIIYLVYRPRSPHFEISDASLNAAYLDMGYLLNADLTLLVNFTNPNKKMSVDLNFIVLKLRYESNLVANQYIEPFEAGKLEHKFARVEMVGSQIRLPLLVTQQLIKQIQGNKIAFELDGYFHARFKLGSIFHYSYWLYSHCKIVTKGPPSGVVISSQCITKR